MNTVKGSWFRRLSNRKPEPLEEEDEPPALSPDRWWSQELSLSAGQAGAVSKYIKEYISFSRPRIEFMMLGSDGVGKLSLIGRLFFNKFQIVKGYDPTTSDYFEMHVGVDGKDVQYNGQTDAPGANPGYAPEDAYQYMRHCETFLFVYDVGSRASFEAMKRYYEFFVLERSLERRTCFRRCCYPFCSPRPPYHGVAFFIANKIDKDEKYWEVTMQEGKSFSGSIGGTFIPVSARTGEDSSTDLLANMTRLIFLRRIHYLYSTLRYTAVHSNDDNLFWRY